jgi:hypothetical protein
MSEREVRNPVKGERSAFVRYGLLLERLKLFFRQGLWEGAAHQPDRVAGGDDRCDMRDTGNNGTPASRAVGDFDGQLHASFKAVSKQEADSGGTDIGDFAGPASVLHGPCRPGRNIEIAGETNPGAAALLHAGESPRQRCCKQVAFWGKRSPIGFEGWKRRSQEA